MQQESIIAIPMTMSLNSEDFLEDLFSVKPSSKSKTDMDLLEFGFSQAITGSSGLERLGDDLCFY